MNEHDYMEAQMISKEILLKLEKGELNWSDEYVQFFIPIALYFTDFDWLKLMAEHNLIEEDCKIVNNFLDMVQTIMQVNTQQLEEGVKNKIKNLFGDD